MMALSRRELSCEPFLLSVLFLLSERKVYHTSSRCE